MCRSWRDLLSPPGHLWEAVVLEEDFLFKARGLPALCTRRELPLLRWLQCRASHLRQLQCSIDFNFTQKVWSWNGCPCYQLPHVGGAALS